MGYTAYSLLNEEEKRVGGTLFIPGSQKEEKNSEEVHCLFPS